MPHQLGITIRAPVAAGRVAELRDWLAEIARKGLAEGPFDFTHLRRAPLRQALPAGRDGGPGRPTDSGDLGVHERGGRAAAPSPSRAVDLAGEGIDQAFGHCTGYPGPDTRRRARIAWLRQHMIPASAFYVNTVGRGLEQIRREARLRDALEDYLDQGDWADHTATEIRRELRAYAAGCPNLAWTRSPAAAVPAVPRR